MTPTYTITADEVESLDKFGERTNAESIHDSGRAIVESRKYADRYWLDAAVKQLSAVKALPAGWDGNAAAAPDPRTLDAGLDLLRAIHQVPGIPKPHINPTRNGGVQFEWETDTGYFELEVVGIGAASYFFQDKSSGAECEGEIFEGESLKEVVQYIVRIAPTD
jgi:hypothetical protein